MYLRLGREHRNMTGGVTMPEEYSTTPQNEIQARISNLRAKLRMTGIDGALILSTIELYYYSGTGMDGAIYIPSDGEPVRLVKRNLQLGKEYSQIPTVRAFGRLSSLFETLDIRSGSRVAIEEDLLPHSFVTFLQSKANGASLVDGSSVFRQLRAVKSEYEIALIERAAELVDQSFEHCAEIATPEMTEIELSSQLDGWMLERGHCGYIATRAFNSVMPCYSFVVTSDACTMNTYFTPVSGPGLSMKNPNGPSHRKLGRNRPFLVDTCGNCEGYISDTTRTFVCGRFGKKTREQLEGLRQVKNSLQRELKPNKNLGELYHETMELTKQLGIHEHFMGSESDKVAFIGHGVGLELDELPIFYAKGVNLVRGNVLACEPKFIIPGRTVLGIEDTYAVTESGNSLLSRAADSFEL
jgi:Xaa-Pro aminopeptidase